MGQYNGNDRGVHRTTTWSFLLVLAGVFLALLLGLPDVPVSPAHLWGAYEVPAGYGDAAITSGSSEAGKPACDSNCYGWSTKVTDNGNGTRTHSWSAYVKTGLPYQCHDISLVTVNTCAGSFKCEDCSSVWATLPHPPGGSATGVVKTARFCGEFSYGLPGPKCDYELCDEMTDCVLTSTGSWWWHAGRQQICRELTYEKYDAHAGDHVCNRRLELDCQQPAPTPTPTLMIPGFVECALCYDTLLFESDRDGNWEIYSAGVDGTGQRRLTENDAVDLGPRWGSNGGWAVFQSDRDGNWEIYRTLVPSHTLERVTNLGSQQLIDAQVLSPEYGQLGRGAALRLLSPIIK
jgi:hypothetical protein